MKIISKHNDYYDSCLAYGHDDHVVYLREHLQFVDHIRDTEVPLIIRDLRALFGKLSRDDSEATDWLSARYYDRMPNHFRGKDHQIDLSTGRILFCGKHYPVVKCHVTPYGVMHPAKDEYFYDADSVINLLTELGVDVGKRSKWAKQDEFARIRDWFAKNTNRQPDYDWMVANKVTCVAYSGNVLSVNPPLKDYQFYRIMDPYTAYQELDMWISGTLAYPQNMMVEIEDKYRIMAHGFDMKYGFRTRPKNAANK